MKTITVLCILLVLGLVANASPARTKSMDFKRKSIKSMDFKRILGVSNQKKINEFWDKFDFKDEDRMIDIGKMGKFF